MSRVLTGEAGAAQWHADRAAIHPLPRLDGPVALLIAFDGLGSAGGGMQFGNAKAAFNALLTALEPLAVSERWLDLQVLGWGSGGFTFTRRGMEAADFDAARAQVASIIATGTFDSVVHAAPAFFAGAPAEARRILFLPSYGPLADPGDPGPPDHPGMAGLRAIERLEAYGFNIDRSDRSLAVQVDTTPQDGVPRITGASPAFLLNAMQGAFGPGPEMNPAHIILECLTNRDWGLGHGDAEIGASFTAAADTLYTEGFGLSLIWQQDSSIEAFIASVLDHVDATLFIDRRTGLWELKLIRADYDPATLPVFDEGNVVDWGRLGRRAPADLVNSVTVRFTDADTDNTGAVTVTDTARVQAMGAVIATTLDYPGVRQRDLALRLAERDLRALSLPILTGEIVVNREGAGLAPGDVIRLRSSRLGLDDVVMRISEIGQGDGRDNGIRLKLAEDVFALGATAIAGGPMPSGPGITAPPRALTRRLVAEAPYWLLVRELGHAEADRILAEDPDTGALMATGERPSADALAARLWIDAGTGPAEAGTVGFAPTALLAADVTDHPEERVLSVTGWREIGAVGIGTLASIGGELVRVDGISGDMITVGRGCLDSVPRAHAAGTPVVFLDEAARITEEAWAAGETLAVRLLPETGRGMLAYALAPEDSVTLDRRAVRPLPPGNVRVNGSHAPDRDALVDGDLVLTWAHRDRLTQTSPVILDHTAASIGPEPGVEYLVEIRWIDPDTGAAIEPPGITIAAGSGTSWVLAPGDVPEGAAPERTAEIDLAVRARREVGGNWVTDREARRFRLTAPFAAGWDRGWGINWGG